MSEVLVPDPSHCALTSRHKMDSLSHAVTVLFVSFTECTSFEEKFLSWRDVGTGELGSGGGLRRALTFLLFRAYVCSKLSLPTFIIQLFLFR